MFAGFIRDRRGKKPLLYPLFVIMGRKRSVWGVFGLKLLGYWLTNIRIMFL